VHVAALGLIRGAAWCTEQRHCYVRHYDGDRDDVWRRDCL
jgi:hypothetical protein